MPHDQWPDPSTSAAQPIVWLLQGIRLGDNQQVLALGAALQARFGWQLVVKQLRFHSGPIPGQDIAHVDFGRSDVISAAAGHPWPDIVIAIGRRMAPVARWIRAQNALKGLHIQLGRFQNPFASVDLLVTTAQYGLPTAPNVVHLSLPITGRRQNRADAATVVASQDAATTGPRIGVMVGGPSNPIRFGAEDAQRLLHEGLAFAAVRHGTLLVATSPRTPQPVLEVLRQGLPAPHRLFPFDATAGAGNPYQTLLARCDAFIVTSDSVSMVADACLTGREVRLFDLPVKPLRPMWQPSWPVAQWVGRRRLGRLAEGKPADSLDTWYDGEVRAARHQPTRHVPIIMNQLLRERHVGLLSDQAAPRQGLDRLMQGELDMVGTRILALMAERRAAALRAGLALGVADRGRATSATDTSRLHLPAQPDGPFNDLDPALT